jgi:hypothetical protein
MNMLQKIINKRAEEQNKSVYELCKNNEYLDREESFSHINLDDDIELAAISEMLDCEIFSRSYKEIIGDVIDYPVDYMCLDHINKSVTFSAKDCTYKQFIENLIYSDSDTQDDDEENELKINSFSTYGF